MSWMGGRRPGVRSPPPSHARPSSGKTAMAKTRSAGTGPGASVAARAVRPASGTLAKAPSGINGLDEITGGGRHEHHIGRFDVAMNDARIVGITCRTGDGQCDAGDHPGRYGSRMPGQPVGERAPLTELGHDERLTAFLANLVDRDDVGMNEPDASSASRRKRRHDDWERTASGVQTFTATRRRSSGS